MAWTYDTRTASLPVVKQNGECHKRSMAKFCPYWTAKHTSKHRVIGYRCRLFDTDKDVSNPALSVPECNAKYGLNYDGNP